MSPIWWNGPFMIEHPKKMSVKILQHTLTVASCNSKMVD